MVNLNLLSKPVNRLDQIVLTGEPFHTKIMILEVFLPNIFYESKYTFFCSTC